LASLPSLSRRDRESYLSENVSTKDSPFLVSTSDF
jgi:hypothetical protein